MRRCLGLWVILLGSLLSPVSAALLMDGTDDRLITANLTGVPTTYPFTIAAVVRLTSFANHPVIAEAGIDGGGTTNGYYLYFETDGRLTLYNPVTTGTVTTTGAVALNAWSFVAVSSASATSHRFFAYNYETRVTTFNETNATGLGPITTPTSSLKLGHWEGPPGTYGGQITGTVRWIALYNKDLTIASGGGFLTMAILGPYTPFTPSLLYTFNEGSGSTVRERIGTGNSATMTNFPASPWQANSFPRP